MKDENKTDAVTALTEQYKTELHKYKEREGLYVKTDNQLKATKQIVLDMSSTIRELKTQNDTFQAEIARLNEEIQLLEMQIKK
jgi:peptidoglycan hydrolase CwlO-like protein